MKTTVHPVIAASAGLLAGALVLQTLWESAEPGSAPAPVSPSPHRVAGSPVPNGGLTVAIDPVTKQIRPPTAEEFHHLGAGPGESSLTATPTEAPQVIRSANGMLSVVLPESYLQTATINRNGDGSFSLTCGEHASNGHTATESSDGAGTTKSSHAEEK